MLMNVNTLPVSSGLSVNRGFLSPIHNGRNSSTPLSTNVSGSSPPQRVTLIPLKISPATSNVAPNQSYTERPTLEYSVNYVTAAYDFYITSDAPVPAGFWKIVRNANTSSSDSVPYGVAVGDTLRAITTLPDSSIRFRIATDRQVFFGRTVLSSGSTGFVLLFAFRAFGDEAVLPVPTTQEIHFLRVRNTSTRSVECIAVSQFNSASLLITDIRPFPEGSSFTGALDLYESIFFTVVNLP